jgi:putative sterol carrier protein
VHILRVLLVPERVGETNIRLKFELDGKVTGLHIRNYVAVPYSGNDADATITTSLDTWTNVLSGATTLSAALADGSIAIAGNVDAAVHALRCFDVKGLVA